MVEEFTHKILKFTLETQYVIDISIPIRDVGYLNKYGVRRKRFV